MFGMFRGSLGSSTPPPPTQTGQEDQVEPQPGAVGGWGMEGKGEKNLDLARKSGQEGAAVTYKSVAVMEGR